MKVFMVYLFTIFYSKIEIMEKENNSIWEISSILLSVENTLQDHIFTLTRKRNI